MNKLKNKAPKKKDPVFKNRAHGKIKTGTAVKFQVENQTDWRGDLTGVLIHEEGEFKIKTERSGTLTIGKRWDVYWNTIEPII